ncbi:hypothetical protein BCD64_18025 [Nostoc sp. MBR 210]|nr:hypothetical protein BCD64_18025 [Nostoc sp. MBR 210]
MLCFSIKIEDISRLFLLLIASQEKLSDRTSQTSKSQSKPNSDRLCLLESYIGDMMKLASDEKSLW